ncbi:hypothetical protein PRZ48_008866 [Zasmidium cellare]|uniref:Uncharacterized protein n=1 Tax=Zasmidium cellare TaxID=395010 RepID=A0ABR0EGP3_ZASCE|nr:hypothetical protein PRZ48_008866 [Zasmidium cellare]
MAFQRILAINELVEMIGVNLDVESLISARRASAAFRNQALAARALRHKLLLSPNNSQAFVWKYHRMLLPGSMDECETVEKVAYRIYDSPRETYFTIKTPNPAILKRTHEPEYYRDISADLGNLLAALHAVKDRLHRYSGYDAPIGPRYYQQPTTCLPGIDRLDVRLRFFPSELDTDSIYYNMFLFHEHTPNVTVHYQLNNWQAGGEYWWNMEQITNPQGVRMRDVVQYLRWRVPQCDTGGEWAVQISVPGAIFPSEREMAMVDDGEEHEEWVARHT